MGGANQIWNSITVYPLWVTMAVGAVVFGTRMTHWIGYDQVRFLASASCGRLSESCPHRIARLALARLVINMF